jgi:spermidine/putrescine transport system permease protein
LIPPGHDEAIIDGLIMSLKLGITSAIGAGIIGTLAGISLGRLDSEGRLFNADVLNTIFLAPLVIPWVVTGIAILVLYSILGISGTFMSLVLGHILIALPFVVIIVSAQMYGLDHSLEEAARNLGASRLRTFYEVTLPLIAPGIIAGMLFAFTISFDNFTQTFFWTNASTQTLPVVIYSKIRFGLDPTVNSIGTIIIIFSVTIALIAERISSRILQ